MSASITSVILTSWPSLREEADHVDGALRHAVRASSCTVIASGITTSRGNLFGRRLEAMRLALLLLALTAHRGERTLALGLGAFERIGDDQPATLPLAAGSCLGAGRLRNFQDA